MKRDTLTVKYHDQTVGTLSKSPNNKTCVFEYSAAWIAGGFSISPLELPLKPGIIHMASCPCLRPYPLHRRIPRRTCHFRQRQRESLSGRLHSSRHQIQNQLPPLSQTHRPCQRRLRRHLPPHVESGDVDSQKVYLS